MNNRYIKWFDIAKYGFMPYISKKYLQLCAKTNNLYHLSDNSFRIIASTKKQMKKNSAAILPNLYSNVVKPNPTAHNIKKHQKEGNIEYEDTFL